MSNLDHGLHGLHTDFREILFNSGICEKSVKLVVKMSNLNHCVIFFKNLCNQVLDGFFSKS